MIVNPVLQPKEPRAKRKCSRSALPWWSHIPGLIPLIIVLVMILVGPGFHFRQGWVVRTATERYACSETSNKTVWSNDKCALVSEKGHASTSLHGFDGSVGLNPERWKQLHLTGQYGCICIVFVVFLAKIFLCVQSYNARFDKVKPIRLLCPIALLPYYFIIGLMSALFAMQVWYSQCGSYSATKLGEYDKAIAKLLQILEKKGRNYTAAEEDRVAECVVTGYGGAAAMALLMALIAAVDARLLYNESKRRRAMSLKGDPDHEHSVTSDLLDEHGHPDQLQVVGGDGGPHAPLKVAIEGGKSGKVEILKTATLVKSKELSNPEARIARKSMKKDQSAQEYDARRKEAVYKYIYAHGGSLLEPGDKKTYYTVKAGERDMEEKSEKQTDEDISVVDNKGDQALQEFIDMI